MIAVTRWGCTHTHTNTTHTHTHTYLIAGRIGGEHHALVARRGLGLAQHAQQGVVPPRHKPHVGVNLQSNAGKRGKLLGRGLGRAALAHELCTRWHGSCCQAAAMRGCNTCCIAWCVPAGGTPPPPTAAAPAPEPWRAPWPRWRAESLAAPAAAAAGGARQHSKLAEGLSQAGACATRGQLETGLPVRAAQAQAQAQLLLRLACPSHRWSSASRMNAASSGSSTCHTTPTRICIRVALELEAQQRSRHTPTARIHLQAVLCSALHPCCPAVVPVTAAWCTSSPARGALPWQTGRPGSTAPRCLGRRAPSQRCGPGQ